MTSLPRHQAHVSLANESALAVGVTGEEFLPNLALCLYRIPRWNPGSAAMENCGEVLDFLALLVTP